MKMRPWIDVSDLQSPGDPEAENAIQAASFVLYSLSGQKYGGIFTTTEQYVCESTGAPVGCSWDPGTRAYWNPAIGAYTYVQGLLPASRGYGPGGSIRLRNRPVRSIESVTVDGVEADPSQYSVYDRAILRPDASVSWGICSSPVVTYEYGTSPPALGKIAARRLADEFILAFHGSDECSLPTGTTSVSRQGLSIEIYDPQEFLKDGSVGLYEVDLFLRTVNPGKAVKRARVFSPDLPRARRFT